jgi:hypothetical protein
MNRYVQLEYRGSALAQSYGFKVCRRTDRD